MLDLLLQNSNVYQVARGAVSEQLSALSLQPYVRTVSSKNNWYSQWRTNTSDAVDYAFTYSDLDNASGNITVQTSGFPYLYDAWSGSRTAIAYYTRTRTD